MDSSNNSTTDTNATGTNSSDATNDVSFEEANARVSKDYMAIPQDRLLQVNADPTTVSITVLGATRRIRTLRSEVVRQTPTTDPTLIDKLPDCAMAVSYTNSMHSIASQPNDHLEAAAQEGTVIKETLYKDVTTLIHHGCLEPSVLKEYTGQSGHKNLAVDLQILGNALNQNWARVQGKCALELAQVKQALSVAEKILRILSVRAQGTAAIEETAEKRTRAFTLLVRSYDEVRRAVHYIRWAEGDADTIAPSLYANRGGGRRKSKDSEDNTQSEIKTISDKTASSTTAATVTTGAPLAVPSAIIPPKPGSNPFMQ